MNIIETIDYPAPKQDYKVLVRCYTYNHSKYIEDALNGFAMQETDFPYVCIIMDDASTDGEQEVIKRWMSRECDMSNAETIVIPTSVVIIVPHKTNENCTFAFYLLNHNLYKVKLEKVRHVTPWRERCEYEALCEGDDYWIDPLKLQKQVDIMKENPKCSLCFHAHKDLFSDGHYKSVNRYTKNINDCPKDDMILGGGGFMATNTMFYKISAYKDYPQWARIAPVGDLPLMLILLSRGEVSYINEIMSVYRRFSIGSWSSRMSADFNKQKRHHRAIVQMWKAFDRWTNFRYHNSVKLKLKINRKYFIKNYLLYIVKSIMRK